MRAPTYMPAYTYILFGLLATVTTPTAAAALPFQPLPTNPAAGKTRLDTTTVEPLAQPKRALLGCEITAKNCFTFTPSSPPSLTDVSTLFASELAAMVYKEPEELTSYVKQALNGTVKFFMDNETDTEAAVIYGGDAIGAIFVALRGTESERDWATDFQYQQTNLTLGVGKNATEVGVHSGIEAALDSVFTPMLDYIEQELKPSKDKPLLFTGHSLGAALATLAAARFASTSPSLPIAGVYSFGGLQVGNAEFRKVYDDVLGLGDKTLRFVYWKDLVPMLPPPSFGFVPVGRTVVFPEEGSCEERKEGEAEYDVCASEAQACTKESPAMAPLTEDFCSSSNGVLASKLCLAVNFGILEGNACCVVSEAINTPDYVAFLYDVHRPELYRSRLYNECAAGCAQEQYQQCRIEWLGEDSALSLNLTPAEAPSQDAQIPSKDDGAKSKAFSRAAYLNISNFLGLVIAVVMLY